MAIRPGPPPGCRPRFLAEQGRGLIERHLLPAVAGLQPRPPQPVGMIEPLQRCLAPHAKRAAIDRVQRVAFQLDHPPLTIARQHAAAGRALPAGGRIPGGLAGDHILVGPDHGKQVIFGLRGATGGKSDTADGCELEKGSAVHAQHPFVSCSLCR
jgi:hypothetical protein